MIKLNPMRRARSLTSIFPQMKPKRKGRGNVRETAPDRHLAFPRLISLQWIDPLHVSGLLSRENFARECCKYFDASWSMSALRPLSNLISVKKCKRGLFPANPCATWVYRCIGQPDSASAWGMISGCMNAANCLIQCSPANPAQAGEEAVGLADLSGLPSSFCVLVGE